MSTTNTISATPLVFARACGAGAEAAGAATPCDASASAGWIGAVAGAMGEFDCVGRPIDREGRPRRRRFAGSRRRILRTLSATHVSLHRLDRVAHDVVTTVAGERSSAKKSAGIARLNSTTLGFLVRRDFLGDRHKRQTRARPTGQTRGAEGVQARREIGEKRKRVGGAGWSGRRGQGVKFACSRLSRDHRESRARDDFRSLPGRPHAGASTLKEGAAWPTRLRTHKRSVCHGMPIWSTAGLAGAASRFGC